jgi:FKBP-type peptidyl-prolyl cis-trans isomerase
MTEIESTASSESSGQSIIKTIIEDGFGDPVLQGNIATVQYTCYLADQPDSPLIAKSTSSVGSNKIPGQKVIVGDGTMIQGMEMALKTMRVGERSTFRLVDSTLGYGSAGIPGVVPPNAVLEMNIKVLDTQQRSADSNIDFDSLDSADNTPRTAADIAAAYQVRQAELAMDGPAPEGFQKFLAKAKNFYFFGLFEGETGQRAPWYLRPSITFPLAFLIVGAAFYVSFVGGAITERGAQRTDELDEIILSSLPLPGSFALAAISLVVSQYGMPHF